MLGGGGWNERAFRLFHIYDPELKKEITADDIHDLLTKMARISLEFSPFLGVGEGDPRLVTQAS
jgi:hypothetical protein